jgi:hypothetical protein
MRIRNIEVYGFRAAIAGMRQPRDSGEASDSDFDMDVNEAGHWECDGVTAMENPIFGPKDLKLMRTLIARGSSHRKFLRMITVWCEMTLPRFVWTDLDTYKVGTVRNSQSSVFTLGSRLLDHTDFEGGLYISEDAILDIRHLQEEYRQHRTAENLHMLKCSLPEGFLQTSQYMFNYEVARAIYHDRENHVLPEFSGPGGICEMISQLPYASELLIESIRK